MSYSILLCCLIANPPTSPAMEAAADLAWTVQSATTAQYRAVFIDKMRKAKRDITDKDLLASVEWLKYQEKKLHSALCLSNSMSWRVYGAEQRRYWYIKWLNTRNP